MAIDAVSPAGGAYPPAQQSGENRGASDARKAADEAARIAKTEEQRQAEQARQDQQAQQNQPPKPVVNAQGQVTGQLLNEVA